MHRAAASLAFFLAAGCGVEPVVVAAGPRLKIEAPPPGVRVWSEVVYDDGTTEAAAAFTDDDGTTTVELDAAPSPVALSSPSACSDSAHTLLGYRWPGRYEWAFNAGTTPANLTRDAAEASLRAAMRNITRSENDCGLADAVSANALYLGRVARGAQIRADGSCAGSGDGKNTMGFGDLPTGVLGITCVWSTADGAAVEADVRFNKVDNRWTTSPTSSCTNRFDVESVATHEIGHVFGLGHVGEANHGRLTMSTQIPPCEKRERTLGRGDVLALRALY